MSGGTCCQCRACTSRRRSSCRARRRAEAAPRWGRCPSGAASCRGRPSATRARRRSGLRLCLGLG
eukprot:1373026-Prymnesium_polylepis.1